MSRLILQNKLEADPESALMRILLIHPLQINILDFCLAYKVREDDRDIPQSHTADQPTALGGNGRSLVKKKFFDKMTAMKTFFFFFFFFKSCFFYFL